MTLLKMTMIDLAAGLGAGAADAAPALRWEMSRPMGMDAHAHTLAALPALMGVPVALLMMAALCGVVFAVFYLIDNMRG